MIVLTNPITLYGKKVVTDLATRSGYATADSFSCTLGCQFKVKEMWAGEDTDANIAMLFEQQQDFDADVSQPHLTEEEYNEDEEREEFEVGVRYNPATDKTSFDNYYRRLEDIASDYLEKYIGNLVFTICRHTGSGGMKQYNSKHREQPVLLSVGDDEGDFTELADLQLDKDENDWSLEMKQTAMLNLPYVIKRLHNMSCYTGVHMLSFIVAYLKAKEKNINMRVAGSVKVLKKNAVIEEGVYLCDRDGDITKRVLVQNKNVRAAEMFDWITEVSPKYKAYYQDYLDFVHYCNVLNVDLFNDDMTKYQSAFVSKLIVTTVTPNKQYDIQVFDAIRNRQPNSVEIPIEDNAIESTINTFFQICDTSEVIRNCLNNHDSLQSEDNLQSAIGLYNVYKLLYYNTSTDTSKYSWENGLLYYDNELAIVSAKMLGTSEFEDDRCLISELGFCIQVSNRMSLYVMTVQNALSNVKNKISYKDPEYKYCDWLRLGT